MQANSSTACTRQGTPWAEADACRHYLPDGRKCDLRPGHHGKHVSKDMPLATLQQQNPAKYGADYHWLRNAVFDSMAEVPLGLKWSRKLPPLQDNPARAKLAALYLDALLAKLRRNPEEAALVRFIEHAKRSAQSLARYLVDFALFDEAATFGYLDPEGEPIPLVDEMDLSREGVQWLRRTAESEHHEQMLQWLKDHEKPLYAVGMHLGSIISSALRKKMGRDRYEPITPRLTLWSAQDIDAALAAHDDSWE